MNKQKTNKPSIGIYTLYVLGAIACFAFFQFCYPYHLFYQEQNQLFLMSWDHVTTYLDKPGWLACLAGDFLTQFYYFRYAGPIILTLCILLTGYNIRCAVEMADIKGRWVAHSVAFIVMILLICFSFHYDYRLSSILAVAGGASVFRVSTSLLISTRMFIKKIGRRNEQGLFLNGSGIANWVSVISIFVSVFVCHWFFGYGVWVYGALTFTGCIANIMVAGTYYRLAALIMVEFRANPPKTILGSPVVKINDFLTLETTDVKSGAMTPIVQDRSNVLQWFTEDGTTVSVRPSGTEPKIKFYFGVKAPLASVADFDEVQAELDAKIEGIKRDLKLE